MNTHVNQIALDRLLKGNVRLKEIGLAEGKMLTIQITDSTCMDASKLTEAG